MRTDQYWVLRTHTKTSLWCFGPIQKPDLRDFVCCGHRAKNDSHTGVRWMPLNHTKILCSLGDEKVASHGTLPGLLRRHTQRSRTKSHPAQSHVLGACVQQCPAAGRRQRRCFISAGGFP
ncbi:unnamed protein product, partial [Ascophyllum nodosum]